MTKDLLPSAPTAAPPLCHGEKGGPDQTRVPAQPGSGPGIPLLSLRAPPDFHQETRQPVVGLWRVSGSRTPRWRCCPAVYVGHVFVGERPRVCLAGSLQLQ